MIGKQIFFKQIFIPDSLFGIGSFMFRSIVVPNWVAKNANGYLNESNADGGKKILRHEKCWLIQTGLMSLKIAYYRVHSEWNGFETEMPTFKTTYTLEPAKVSRDFDRFIFDYSIQYVHIKYTLPSSLALSVAFDSQLNSISSRSKWN